MVNYCSIGYCFIILGHLPPFHGNYLPNFLLYERMMVLL
jgi:hypothetical protein